MKKIFPVFFILLSFSVLFVPTTYAKAETLRDYESLLQKYKDEQKKTQSELNQTESSISSAKNQIESIKKELEEMSQEIINMQAEIVDYNIEIKDKSLETKQLFEYLQVAQNENLYLEYAFDAETMTDLIYRISVIKQMTQYNHDTIKNLEKMISDNQAREKELAVKQEEMNTKSSSLTSKISELSTKKEDLSQTSVSVSQQIDIYQKQIDSYKAAGCKSNDVVGVDCAKTNNVAGWYRPIESGYITSDFGMRGGTLHRGIDLQSKNPYSTKIYPVANGTIQAKYYDIYGALVIVIQHKTANGKYYSSLYAHMSQFAPNIYVGKSVTVNDYIGYMGNTGYSTGPHLHFEIVPCRLYYQGDSNCGKWDNYVSYVKKIYNNGSYKGPREFLYFPNNRYVTFNGRV